MKLKAILLVFLLVFALNTTGFAAESVSEASEDTSGESEVYTGKRGMHSGDFSQDNVVFPERSANMDRNFEMDQEQTDDSQEQIPPDIPDAPDSSATPAPGGSMPDGSDTGNRHNFRENFTEEVPADSSAQSVEPETDSEEAGDEIIKENMILYAACFGILICVFVFVCLYKRKSVKK